MKAIRTFLLALVLAFFGQTASYARPMTGEELRFNARLLTDRMVYTLGLSSGCIDDLYCINYDYLYGVNDYLDDIALGRRYDEYMYVVEMRDDALRRLLGAAAWTALVRYDYLYRPISFVRDTWNLLILSLDLRPTRFYYRVPRYYKSYCGGHFFHGMPPRPRPYRFTPAVAPGRVPDRRPERPPYHFGDGHVKPTPRPDNRPGGRPSAPVDKPSARPDNNRRPDSQPSNRPERPSRPSGNRGQGLHISRTSGVSSAGGRRSSSNMRSSSRNVSRSSSKSSGRGSGKVVSGRR